MDQVESVLGAVREFLSADCPLYTDILRRSFEVVDPVFVRPKYSDFFWHCATTVPGWLPQVVRASAEAESDGSVRLLTLWKAIDTYAEAERWILSHALDEARHSKLFLHLVALAFPQAVSPEELAITRSRLNSITKSDIVKSDSRASEEVFIDHLLKINMGEIRTRIHMHLLAPVIFNLTPVEHQAEMARILDGLDRDEVRHIAYTVQILEEWAKNGGASRMDQMYADNLHAFHHRTMQETEGALKQFGLGQFPELLEI
jgi:hypothetical protein